MATVTTDENVPQTMSTDALQDEVSFFKEYCQLTIATKI